MLAMQFGVAVLVSAIDPLLILAYVAAGILGRNWRLAGLFGLATGLAAIVLVGLAAKGAGWQPRPFYLAAQLVACGLAAMLVRVMIDLVRRKPVAA